MRKQPLTSEAKAALEHSVGSHFTLHWLEDLRARLRVARLLSLNGKLRLTLPEAYATHRDIIQWDSRFSEDKIPDRAVGMDAVGAKLMRWALHSWDRVNFLNTYLGGTLLPRVQLDFVPAVACAAHFVMVAAEAPQSIDEHVLVGRSWQRFWLTATQHDLWCQPEMTPLIFSAYVRNGTQFSDNERSRRLANSVSERLDEILTADVSRRAVVMGRIGTGAAPTARSVRLPLERLMVTPGDTPA